MCHTVSAVAGSSVNLQDLADDFPIIEGEIVEKDTPWTLRDLTSRVDSERSDLQRIQNLCRFHGLAVLFNIWSVQGLVKAELEALGLSSCDKGSFAEHKKLYEARKTELE